MAYFPTSILLLIFANSCILTTMSSQCFKEHSFPFQELDIAMNDKKNKHDILVYTKDHCPYCDRAKELLQKKGASFREINLTEHPELIPEMIERSQRKTVPQIFINHQSIGGCDDLYELESSGKLDLLLA